MTGELSGVRQGQEYTIIRGWRQGARAVFWRRPLRIATKCMAPDNLRARWFCLTGHFSGREGIVAGISSRLEARQYRAAGSRHTCPLPECGCGAEKTAVCHRIVRARKQGYSVVFGSRSCNPGDFEAVDSLRGSGRYQFGAFTNYDVLPTSVASVCEMWCPH